MAEMTSHERFLRMFEHREADRVPLKDTPWGGTLNRWRREGMPSDAVWEDYFGFDRVVSLGADTSPRYEEKIVSVTDTHTTKTTSWGVTLRHINQVDSTPEFLDFTIKDPDSWRAAKQRMEPSRDRVNWARVDENYKYAKKNGLWIEGGFWFGFDITHSWMVGTETLLMALLEEPEWCFEMFNHELDMCIAQMQMILDAGYEIDCIRWPDDMGYKHNTFFSLALYRELLKPVQKRACDWAHERGIKTYLHSCGYIEPFLPDLIEIGIDCLNPLEVKAGMDPLSLKEKFGDKLVFHGGLNAVLFEKEGAFLAEIERILPVLKQGGGYIFGSDHSIPNTVTTREMREIVETVKRLGAYS